MLGFQGGVSIPLVKGGVKAPPAKRQCRAGPKAGARRGFTWVTYHWIAGALLTVSIVFHVIHASFWLDFWSIWPDKVDLRDAWRRMLRFLGRPAPLPRKFAKYPLENKLYHGAIIVAGLSAIFTGVFMMFRVRTIF